MTVLAAIRAEIEPLEQRLHTLRELERLALSLDGAGEGAGATPSGISSHAAARAERAPAPSRTPSQDGLSERAQRALEIIRERGEIKPGELAAELGVHRTVVSRVFPPLVDRGLIELEGAARSRVVRAVTVEAAASKGTPGGRQLAELKEAIVNHVAARPGTEQQFAQRLKVNREDVAFAIGQLLVDGKVTLDPDGTYRAPRLNPVVQVLQRVGGTVTTDELRYQLARHSMDAGGLDAELAHLRATGQIVAGDRGWTLPPTETSAA